MAAKNKNTSRRGATGREPDIQDIFALHLTASQHREARKRLTAAQEIQHRLTALETEVRLSSRGPESQ
jgi:hypothetical protein